MGGPSPGYRWAAQLHRVCPQGRVWMRAVLALLAAAAWVVPRREHAEARAVQRRRARRRAARGRAVRRAPVHGAHAGWQSGERLRARARGRRTVEGPEAVGVSRVRASQSESNPFTAIGPNANREAFSRTGHSIAPLTKICSSVVSLTPYSCIPRSPLLSSNFPNTSPRE